MIDILLIAEIAWCAILLGMKNLERTLLYVAGFLASGYVALECSTWLSRALATSANATFVWLTQQIVTPVESVGIVATVIPPEETLGGPVQHAQWVAQHVFQGLLYICMTSAVFLLFIVIDYLSTALWDRPKNSSKGIKKIFNYVCATCCGCYLAILTGFAFANLSWLEPFQPLSKAVGHSYLLQQFTVLLTLLTSYVHHFIV